jgi:outer membrane protein TolC
MNASEFRELALYILACFTMTGCMVGPNFEPPQSATPDVFNRTQTAQATSKPVEADFGPQWWTLFNDPTLDSLEQQLADANLDVAAASARLRQSRAEQRIAGADEYPTLARSRL